MLRAEVANHGRAFTSVQKPCRTTSLWRLNHFQSLEDRHKEQALFKGLIVEPGEIIQLVNLAPDLVSQ